MLNLGAGNGAGPKGSKEGARAMSATATTRRLTLASNVTQGELAELSALGFSPTQIHRLVELRAIYPLLEQVYTKEELQRLLFLKWLHTQWSGDHTAEPLDA
jgi:hypothetical protein